MIGAVTLSPTRSRVGAYFDVQRENIRTDDAVDFLRRLRKKLQRPLIIVWDRWNVHRSAAKPEPNHRLITMRRGTVNRHAVSRPL